MTRNKYFSAWYAAHKQELSEARKKRYRSDPEYRRKALANQARQRERRKASHAPPPYTTRFSEAAQKLGITIWRLRNWRTMGYFPEPYHYGKSLYFTDAQIGYLEQLNTFIDERPRLSRVDKEKLADLVALIFANW